MVDEDNTEAEEAEDTSIEFGEMMEFASGQVAEEADQFDGDVPNHAGRLVAARSSDLLQTITNIEMAQASEAAEGPDDDAIREAVTNNVVDILLALGAVKYEYDLDLAEAFAERMEFIKDFQAFEEAMQEAENQEEMMEVMDEHMDDRLAEEIGAPPMGGMGMPEPGDNVDREDYDHDDEGRSFA